MFWCLRGKSWQQTALKLLNASIFLYHANKQACLANKQASCMNNKLAESLSFINRARCSIAVSCMTVYRHSIQSLYTVYNRHIIQAKCSMQALHTGTTYRQKIQADYSGTAYRHSIHAHHSMQAHHTGTAYRDNIKAQH